MKKAILLFTILLSMFASCVKEDETKKEEVPVVIKNSHRITRSNQFNSFGVITYQSRYTYEGERLVTMSSFRNDNDQLKEIWRSEYTYSLNEVTCIETNINGTFPSIKRTYKLENDLLVEYRYHTMTEGQYEEESYFTYKYLDGKLISFSYFNKNNEDIMREVQRGSISYDNGKVKEYMLTSIINNVWADELRLDCFYENGNLVKRDQSIYDAGTWILRSTWEFFYNGSDIATATYVVPRFEMSSLYTFKNSYLDEVVTGDTKTTYEYEAGHGNASLFYGGPTSLIFDVLLIK